MARPDFLFLGEAVWLDLANTAPLLTSASQSSEQLPDAESVRDWLAAAGLPLFEPRADPGLIYPLRDQCIRLATALADGGRPPTASIAAINGMLRGSPGRESLTRVAGAWQLRFLPVAPPGPLEAVARSAAATLANPLAQVRRCAEPSCQLFFLDTTPHHTRAWCRESGHVAAAVERRRISRPQSMA